MRATQRSITIHPDARGAEEFRTEPQCEAEAGFDHLVENHVIGLYPEFRFQTVEGFGCAMTESACYLLSQMTAEKRRDTLACWFGPEAGKARFIRIPMDSCDYSLSEYQAVADPIDDPELKTFSIDRDRQYILPAVKEALALSGGKLSALLSPWSPPWQWKTPPLARRNDAAAYGGQEAGTAAEPSRCNGGRLKPEYYPAWARYVVKYLEAYLAEGIPVTMLSVQNEAAAATPWDSCVWTGEEEKTFLKDHLAPALRAAGLADRVQVFIWDHNKERMIEHIGEMMTPETEKLIGGFAYHWYTGDHFEALGLLGAKYPDKILMHTESCPLHMPGRVIALEMDVEELKKKPRAALAPEELAVLEQAGDTTPAQVDQADAFAYAHDIIGDLNQGMQRWIDWNLIVDQDGGPRHVPGGFAAPLTLNAAGEVIRTPAYAWLNLIMQAVPAGSVRIGKSVYGAAVEAAAVKTPEGRVQALLFYPGKQEEHVYLRLAGQVISAVLPGESLTCISIDPENC